MKNLLVLSALLAAVLSGCGSSSCCSDVKAKVQNPNPGGSNPDINPDGGKVIVPPKTDLSSIPDNDLKKMSNTQLVLDGANYSSDEDGTVKSYIWTFKKPDGTSTTYNDEKPTFTFPTVGTYTICLSVKDDDQQVSNQSCRNVVVEDQPVYIKPEPVVKILDSVTKQPLPTNQQGKLILQTGSKVIFDGTDSYDPDTLDSNKIVAYRWKLIEYRKYPNGYTFKYHYCNWPNEQDHSSCAGQIPDSNGVPYAQIPYTIHAGSSPEIHRTIELCVEDQDYVDGKNDQNCKTYEYDTELYNGEDLTQIPEYPNFQ